MTSYNLGIRLVRNAGNERSGTVTAEGLTDTQTTGKILKRNCSGDTEADRGRYI